MVKTSGITEIIQLGKFSQEGLDHIIREASALKDISKRIEFLSRQFLDIEYKESTLTGGADMQEAFVINLEEVDCFTYLEYVEAMRLSDSFSAFKDTLKMIRYKSAIVSFDKRKHFFTDWPIYNADFVEEISEEISSYGAIHIQKILNRKEDDSLFLPGIQPFQREVSYIPSDAINDSVYEKLMSGDYIGIYSSWQGLDVSHVGIFIQNEDKKILRHASSQKEYRKVIDQDLKTYLINKPGIIVCRPKNPQ